MLNRFCVVVYYPCYDEVNKLLLAFTNQRANQHIIIKINKYNYRTSSSFFRVNNSHLLSLFLTKKSLPTFSLMVLIAYPLYF